jgi:hypothetical protein
MALVPWSWIHWKSPSQKAEHCSDYDTSLARMQVGRSMYLVERVDPIAFGVALIVAAQN